MTFSELFETYYTLYRSESDAPGTSDDEWAIAVRLANEAISRWENYDNTFWQQLYATVIITTVSGQSTYTCPSDMRSVGGFVKHGMVTIPIKNLEDVQFLSPDSNFAYFTGDPTNGYTLNLSRSPENDGETLTFMYYKKATKVVDGDSTPGS